MKAEDGLHLASAESGDLLYWNLETRTVVYSEHRSEESNYLL